MRKTVPKAKFYVIVEGILNGGLVVHVDCMDRILKSSPYLVAIRINPW